MYNVINRGDKAWSQVWTEKDLLRECGNALSSMVLSTGYTVDYTATRIEGLTVYLTAEPDNYGNIKKVFEGEYPCHVNLLFPDFEISKR